jgi:PAS domain S-box-containing protein
MNTNYKGSCETILSLIKAANIISGKLTTSKNLQESLENIFSQFSNVPSLKKAWVYMHGENDSLSNVYAYNDEIIRESVAVNHPLHQVLMNGAITAFHAGLLPSEYSVEANDRFISFPSLINNEIMAISLVIINCSDEDVATVTELLDIVFTKIGSIVARIDYEYMIREQQQNLDNLLAGIDDMLFIVNEKGKIIHFNNAAQRILGYNEEELSTMKLEKLRREEDADLSQQELSLTIQKGGCTSYLPFVSAAAKAIPVETTISKGLWNSKPILILIVRNLTDFENARNEIILARLKAEEASKAKSQFLRKMSHQFRVPLNSILGMTELLMKTDLTQKQFSFLNVILRSTENLMGILNDILDFNKIENNEVTLENKCYNLKDVIQLVMSNGYYITRNKGVELLSDFGHYGKDTYLKGDPLRLFQILMNLVQFCSDETQRGKVEIGIEMMGSDTKNLILSFRITDTSEGLNPEELEDLLNNIATSRHNVLYNHVGSGLGLSISWHLVKLMGGKLDINSSHKGNNFTFSLTQEICDQQCCEELKQTQKEVHCGQDQSFRILLAEDQVFNQMVIQAMVEEWGIKIDIAENGAECIKKLKENSDYNLVLMDIQMPVMDGVEATRKIRNEFAPPLSEIPVIAITAHAYADEHRKFLAAGMNDTVTKPFRSQVLFQKIANCLGISRTVMGVAENYADLHSISQQIEASYDLTLVRNITKGNQQSFEKMIRVFVEKSGEEMIVLKKALEEKDWEMMSNTAHKMKPALAYMGMKLLEQEVNNLYHLCKNQQDEVLIKNIVSMVDEKLLQVCERLKKEKV